MTYSKNQVTNGHLYLGEVKQSTYYKIDVIHDGKSKFLVEILDNVGNILYRPNNFEAKSIPNVPYSMQFISPYVGILAVHYFESAEDTWENVIVNVEVK
jgi:hypothetical protein